MNKPVLDDLMKQVDSRYSLVVAAAKRARTITEGTSPKVDSGSNKTVSVALEEIALGFVGYERTSSGIK